MDTEQHWFMAECEDGLDYFYCTQKQANYHFFDREHPMINRPPQNWLDKKIAHEQRIIDFAQLNIDFYKKFGDVNN